MRNTADILRRASQIKLLLMDVDGVLTNGLFYFFPGPDGKPVEFKGFNTQDGLSFHMLNAAGIKTGVISGRESPGLTEHARLMKMTYVHQGHLEKEAIFDSILKEAKLKEEQVAYIGDDFTDAPQMVRCGLAVSVADGRSELRAIAHYVTEERGGNGAVREVAELILRSQNLWDAVLEKYKLKDVKKKATIGL